MVWTIRGVTTTIRHASHSRCEKKIGISAGQRLAGPPNRGCPTTHATRTIHHFLRVLGRTMLRINLREASRPLFDPVIEQDTRGGEDSQSMAGSELSSQQAPPPQSMPPPPIPPSSRRRHRSQLSAVDIEAQVHMDRMENMRT